MSNERIVEPAINVRNFVAQIEARNELVRNLAPELLQYSMEVMLKPSQFMSVTVDRLKTCFRGVASRANGFVFAGPFYVGPDMVEGIKEGYIALDFTARDRQVMGWWTDSNAPYVRGKQESVGGVLPNSHGVIYWFPEHGLIDVIIRTCMKFDPEPVKGFLDVFWQPDPGDMQSIFHQVTTGETVSRSPQARETAAQLYSMLAISGVRSTEDILRDGDSLEKIILGWDSNLLGSLNSYLTENERISMQNLYGLYEGVLERQTSQQIISGQADERAFLKYGRYKRLTDREMEKGRIGVNSRVTFIGGGWLPISAILYARAGAWVRVIEKDPERAKIATQVIEKLDLSSKIKVIYEDAEQVDFTDVKFDNNVFVIAAMARTKTRILDKLTDRYGWGDTIIIRTTVGARHFLYEDLMSQELHFRLPEYDYYQATGPENDDIISFTVTTIRPNNLAGDKDDYNPWLKELRDKHGYKESSHLM